MIAMNKIEEALEIYMKNTGSPYSRDVYDAMNYSLLGGGKRIRPILVLEFCKLCGGNAEHAVPYACAVEMIHTYSLIHDDLPCMDNDEMRRGKPSNHIAFGEDIALLAGDGLLTRAFEICLSQAAAKAVGYERAVEAAHILAKLAGADGMVGGQCIDLKTEGKVISMDELKAMVMGKTVGLVKAACLMGTVVGGGSQEQLAAAEKFAEGIGMAFQIRDDILDVTGDAAVLGKNTGVDSQNSRCNYVTLLGLDKADELVKEYTESALKALDTFGGDITELRGVALKLAARES